MTSAADPATGLLTAAVLILLAGILGALARGRAVPAPALAYGPAGVGSILALIASLLVLGSDRPLRLVLPGGSPGMSPSFRLDGLGALFTLVLALLGLGVSICGSGGILTERGRSNGLAAAGLPLCLLAALGLFAAADAFVFLLSWGLLAIAFTLARSGAAEAPPSRGSRLGVLLYAGGFLLAAAFFLLAAPAGDAGFEALAEAAPLLSASSAAAISLLFLLGFGVAAGVIPFHRRFAQSLGGLPPGPGVLAASVLPAVAAYGLVRAVYDWLPRHGNAPAILLLLGSITLLAGAFDALMAREVTLLVARSTVAGVGLLLIGLGSSLAFAGRGDTEAAAYALTAALYGVIGLSTTRSLLACAAGAVAAATGTLELDRLGGLARRMPRLSLALLAGAAATASLPPFHGFIATWMTAHALLAALRSAATTPLLGSALVLATLALAVGLSLGLALMVLLAGTALLGRPRSPEARAARDVSLLAGLGLFLPAFLALALGLFAGRFVPEVGRIAGGLVVHGSPSDLWAPAPLAGRPASLGPGSRVSSPQPYATLSIPAMASALLAAVIVPLLFLIRRRKRRRDDRAWTGGGTRGETVFSTAILSQPFSILYRPLYGARDEAELLEGASPSFPRRIRFHHRLEPVWRPPLARAAETFAHALTRMPPIGAGSARLPLVVLLAFVALLAIAAAR